MEVKARVIAIYLPQYHPIPENDAVWGRGFTEWVNVAQARPLFKGHYQPRIPKDLGFYDLRMPEIREAQAAMAKNAGIEGFMYWQYYFGRNKKLLQMPFEEVLSTGKPNFPFCLGWANHSWQTKTWKRETTLMEGKTMIMEQLYEGENQFIEHFMYNLKAFKDKRYMTIEGKPVFIIWNPMDHSEEISQMIESWKKLSQKYGLEGIYFIGRQYMGDSVQRILNMGFDAVYQERIGNMMNNGDKYTLWYRLRSHAQTRLGIQLGLNKHDFKKKYKLLISDESFKSNVIPTLIAGYDRSPRSGNKAQILYNFTPEAWSLHIDDALNHVLHKDDDHRVIILKSWNEWGESNYLEPDLKYGSTFLDILKDKIIK